MYRKGMQALKLVRLWNTPTETVAAGALNLGRGLKSLAYLVHMSNTRGFNYACHYDLNFSLVDGGLGIRETSTFILKLLLGSIGPPS